jgi:hypothetical protein
MSPRKFSFPNEGGRAAEDDESYLVLLGVLFASFHHHAFQAEL